VQALAKGGAKGRVSGGVRGLKGKVVQNIGAKGELPQTTGDKGKKRERPVGELGADTAKPAKKEAPVVPDWSFLGNEAEGLGDMPEGSGDKPPAGVLTDIEENDAISLWLKIFAGSSTFEASATKKDYKNTNVQGLIKGIGRLRGQDASADRGILEKIVTASM